MTKTARPGNGITEGVIWKQLLRFFFPILFGSFFQQLYNTTDAVIVGNFVGKEALAAVGGSTGTLINLLVGFFVGLSSGATVMVAQYYGAQQPQEVSKTVHTGHGPFHRQQRLSDGAGHRRGSLGPPGHGYAGGHHGLRRDLYAHLLRRHSLFPGL